MKYVYTMSKTGINSLIIMSLTIGGNMFINCSKALLESDITEVEKKLGLIFPDELKNHYLRYNGGKFKGERCVFLYDNGNDYTIKYFMPIKYKRTDGDQLLETGTEYFTKIKK